MRKLIGFGASAGVADGIAYRLVSAVPAIPEFEDAMSAFQLAATVAADQLSQAAGRAEQAGLNEAADILRAQAMMATDPMLEDEVRGRVGQGLSLSAALSESTAMVAKLLEASGSEYLAARAADIGEIERRIRFALGGAKPSDLTLMGDPGVVVAEALTAADTAALNPEKVQAFVTESGGPTGHVAVIARALGIPAAVGVTGALAAIAEGSRLIVDGSNGTVFVDPDEETVAKYQAQRRQETAIREAATAYRGRAVAFGERKMTIAANVGNPAEVESAVMEGADGIGLYRTEFLYLDTDQPPDEATQIEIYRQALSAFEHPVVVRTFDIGGDKPARYLDMPYEENPFLGVRGMRLYSIHTELALTQARALLRSADAGELWVMAPMVGTLDDIATMRDLFERARGSLVDEGLSYGPIKLGIMIEIPAAALIAEAMASKVDFFSIGTNDLTQYALAVDRTAGGLAAYSDAAHPAVLKLCQMTAAAARKQGISVSICGEAGADQRLAPIFAAMGMDKLSVNTRSINSIKQRIDQTDPTAATQVLARCLGAESSAEVREILLMAALAEG